MTEDNVPVLTEERESDPELDPDLDPLVRGTDPGIRIRTKMSRIPNTGFLFLFLFFTNISVNVEGRPSLINRNWSLFNVVCSLLSLYSLSAATSPSKTPTPGQNTTGGKGPPGY